MSSAFIPAHIPVGWSLFLIMCLLNSSGCNSQNADVAKNSASAAENHDDVEVPSGSPDELFAFMAELDREKLPEDPSARGEALRIRMSKRVRACDAILSQDVAPEAETSAVRMKLDALRTLSIVDPMGAGAQFEPYVTSLINGPDPYLARLAKAKRFQRIVNDYVAGTSDNTSAITDGLRDLLRDENAGPSVFMEARDAVNWLLPAQQDELTTDQLQGRLTLAAECFRAIGDRYRNFEDQNVANEAVGLLRLSDQLELELLGSKARSGEDGAAQDLVEKIRGMFDSEEPHGNEMAFAIQTAQMLEFEGLLKPAMQLYELAWKNARSDIDQGRRDHVQNTFEKAKVRLALEGKPMVINGVLQDGSKFDWSDYAGRHVVVCFWESWIEGWQDEVKGMQNIVAQYKDKPIDIVTINLDAPENLEKYLVENELVLPTVISEDPNRSGTNNPNALRYGVDAIPFTVLVNPDGFIEKIHVFGPHLADALQKTFGTN